MTLENDPLYRDKLAFKMFQSERSLDSWKIKGLRP